MIDTTAEIGKKLRAVCPNVQIYRNNVDGGFKLPAFLVQKIGTKRAPLLMNDQYRTYSYQLVYFPENEEHPASELEAVESQLLDNLVALDDAHITNVSTQVLDNTLVTSLDVETTARYVSN